MLAGLLALAVSAPLQADSMRHVVDRIAPSPDLAPTDSLADIERRRERTRANHLHQKFGTTLFVNFDGARLEYCRQSDSHKNCSSFNTNKKLPAYSGTLAHRAAILDAIRRDVQDYGIRVTGTRPSKDEDYVMVIVSGTEEDYGALGEAPSGDCGDTRPNEIAFAYLDGDLVTWVNGAANTILQEAAHTWGLDHTNAVNGIMFPSGNNSPTGFRTSCDPVVADVLLRRTAGTCPPVNDQFCGSADLQSDAATLQWLFGPPYEDDVAPVLTLLNPEPGEYFQAPGEFDVEIHIEDDQEVTGMYTIEAWLEGQPRPEPYLRHEANFPVAGLPVGVHTFHVRVTDAAGNQDELEFSVEVGEDPPPQSCECRSGSARALGPWAWLLLPYWGLVGGRRRR